MLQKDIDKRYKSIENSSPLDQTYTPTVTYVYNEKQVSNNGALKNTSS